MTELIIKETIQAGDVFLIKYNCPMCAEENFSCWKDLKCKSCKQSGGTWFEFSNSKKSFRCISGTERKHIKFRKRTIRTLMDIQNNFCAYCDKYMEEFHIDHIVPLSFGGTNNVDNLVLSCPKCNLKASSKVFLSFCDKRDYLRSSLKIDV